MSAEPGLSGGDLARQVLTAAREAARKNGACRPKPKRRTGAAAVRRDGREPLGLGSAISRMLTERGMTAPVASSPTSTRSSPRSRPNSSAGPGP
ncbi:hypothetical protein ACWCPT_16205 [Streptomyces sp. NPDC002308]